MPVIKHKSLPCSNFVPSATASGFGQSSIDSFDMASDDQENLTPNNVAVTTRDSAAHLLTSARLYLNSPHQVQKNWGQMNPNRNDYHSDPMEISHTVWIPHITDR